MQRGRVKAELRINSGSIAQQSFYTVHVTDIARIAQRCCSVNVTSIHLRHKEMHNNNLYEISNT